MLLLYSFSCARKEEGEGKIESFFYLSNICRNFPCTTPVSQSYSYVIVEKKKNKHKRRIFGVDRTQAMWPNSYLPVYNHHITLIAYILATVEIGIRINTTKLVYIANYLIDDAGDYKCSQQQTNAYLLLTQPRLITIASWKAEISQPSRPRVAINLIFTEEPKIYFQDLTQ